MRGRKIGWRRTLYLASLLVALVSAVVSIVLIIVIKNNRGSGIGTQEAFFLR